MYKGIDVVVDKGFKGYNISSAAEYYIYYRFFIRRAEGGDPGLNHLQLFSADQILQHDLIKN